MKNTGIILLGVAAGLVTAVIAYAILSNAQNREPLGDEEFIEQARSSAAGSIGTEVATAPRSPATADETTQPRIELETDHYHMGTIANDEKTEGQIMVYNRGKAPLLITKVTTQCGCTQGAMPKGRETIPPGGQVPLEVIVDPFRIPTFTSTKTLTLYSNDPNNPTITVKVSADVAPEVEIEPASLDFGPVAKGETPQLTYIVRQVGDQTFDITGQRIAGTRDAFDVSFKERPVSEWKTPGHKEYLVTAKVRPSAPTGDLRASAMLSTDFKRLKNLPPFPITVTVNGVYNLDKRVVTLRGVKPGETTKAVLKLTAAAPVELTEIQTANAALIPSQRPGDEPNSILIDVTIVDNPDQRWQRDTWTLKVKANGQVFTEDIRVMAIIDTGASSPIKVKSPTSPETTSGIN